jgi:hypothetical protein
MTTKLLRFSKLILLNSNRRFRWLFQDSKFANPEILATHLLVVKNPVYARLARTCVESFLHYHPNSQVIIHYDTRTWNALKRQLCLLRLFRRGRLRFERLSDDPIWQESKLDIILSISGTNNIFMDCDLRWNGAAPLPSNRSILYFVKERALESYKGVLEVLPSRFHSFGVALMKNTSVFSWSYLNLSDASKERVKAVWLEFQSNCKQSYKPELQSVSRISEQIVLSILPDLEGYPFTFLKELDQQFDGSVCESSYYGASQGRFAIWGNTNRKSLFKGL